MPSSINENDQTILNCLGSHVPNNEIPGNKLLLSYFTTDGFVDNIVLWSSYNEEKTKCRITYNKKSPKTIQLASNDKSFIFKNLAEFRFLKSLKIFMFFDSLDSLELIGRLKNLNTLIITQVKPTDLPDSIGTIPCS